MGDGAKKLVEYLTVVLLKIICEIQLFSVTRQRQITDEVTLFYPMRQENKLNFINSSDIYVIQILRTECFTSKRKEK